MHGDVRGQGSRKARGDVLGRHVAAARDMREPQECGEVDVEDMRRRFCDWLYKGAYTSDGSAFDVGNATATALERDRGCDGERSNGNGSLMRIAPLVFVHASDDEVRDASAITHAHWISTEACVMFVRILGNLMDGECLEDAIYATCSATSASPFSGTWQICRAMS